MFNANSNNFQVCHCLIIRLEKSCLKNFSYKRKAKEASEESSSWAYLAALFAIASI